MQGQVNSSRIFQKNRKWMMGSDTHISNIVLLHRERGR